jgi:hypothetical protein
MKRKYEYIEGRKARENFETAMKAAFQIPKEKAPGLSFSQASHTFGCLDV